VATTVSRLAAHRYLLSQLVRKEIKLRYKRSALGILWSLIHPLAMMGIFTLVFSRFPRLSGMTVPYYAFFLTGYLPWIFFQTAISNAHGSIIVNASLVKQVYFPRWLLPLASCLSNLVHFLIAYGLWLVYLLLFLGALSPRLVLLPVAVLILFALLVGLALILSAVNVFFRDVGQILEVLLQFLFFLTPVIYTFDIFPPQDARIVTVLGLNPMAQVVLLLRGILLPGFPLTVFSVWYPAAWAAAMVALGIRTFRRADRTMAKEL
jgi:lipopolysaccharide transport system permease protein